MAAERFDICPKELYHLISFRTSVVGFGDHLSARSHSRWFIVAKGVSWSVVGSQSLDILVTAVDLGPAFRAQLSACSVTGEDFKPAFMEHQLMRIFNGDNNSDPLSKLNHQICLLAFQWFVGPVS